MVCAEKQDAPSVGLAGEVRVVPWIVLSGDLCPPVLNNHCGGNGRKSPGFPEVGSPHLEFMGEMGPGWGDFCRAPAALHRLLLFSSSSNLVVVEVLKKHLEPGAPSGGRAVQRAACLVMCSGNGAAEPHCAQKLSLWML